MKLKELSQQNRPRERLINFGPRSLSDAELLAIILCSGTRQENVLDLSNRIISELSINGLSQSTISELTSIKGIGQAKACKIAALFELSKRTTDKTKLAINNAEQAARLYIDKLKDLKKEYIYLLMLNTKNQLIKEEIISIGTLDTSLIHPREVFNPAIRNNAASIILIHNHPSGNPEPSEEDIKTTNQLRKTAEIVGIRLLDHIIVGDERWRSL